jgi:hypothetical protein
LAENESLKAEMNGNNALVKEKVEQSSKQAKLIREVIFFWTDFSFELTS